MRKQWLALACSLAMVPVALPVIAHGDEADADKTNAEKAWDIEVEASYLLKNGNSKGESIVGKASASHDGETWRQNAKLEAVNTLSQDNDDGDEERTAERYYAFYKLDRKLANNFYLFNALTYEKDRFSGYQYQASYAAGLGRRFIDTGTQTLDLEAGPGYRVQCLEPDTSYFHCSDSEDSAIARVAGSYKWKINDIASFGQDVITEIGEENTSLRSETSLTSKINAHFAMRLSYLLTRDSYVPAGTHNTDSETTVSLVYTF